MSHVRCPFLAVFAFVPIVTVQAQPIFYVDQDATGANDGSSWLNAYNNLQDALADAAEPGSGVTEIRVAQGVYKRDQGRNQTPGDRDATFHVYNGVALRGGYAGAGGPDPDVRDVLRYETILSGDLNGNDRPDQLITLSDNSRHVVGMDGDERTILDGFTITAGNADDYGSGGGIYCYGTPTVVNCTIFNNRADTFGGGMWAGNATVVDCTFRENSASFGGAVIVSGTPAFTRCRFINNRADGRYSWFGGGAMAVMYGASFVITNSEFVENQAANAGGAVAVEGPGGVVAVINCKFTGNSAGTGAALSLMDGNAILTNCTLSRNVATFVDPAAAGIDVFNYGTLALTNSVLWGNVNSSGGGEDAQLGLSGHHSTLEVNYSGIEGWTGALGGIGNFGDDPLFVDPPYWDIDVLYEGDTRLLPGSPCIDAGDNGALPGDVTTDFDGNLRFVDDPDTPDTGEGVPPIVDMGAYEYQPPLSALLNLDIRPGSCPNRLTLKGREPLRMAIVATEAFDVADIDTDSLVLTRTDGVGGEVTPITRPPGLGPKVRDVATPFNGEPCDCHKLRRDGVDDLLLRFAAAEMVESLELYAVPDGEFVQLTLRGSLLDGTTFSESDCVFIVNPHSILKHRLHRPR
ncbi:MAG: right-handed parallel beta-helix repeat-containing protein [Planctomycetota bacterium]|jgi:hypothetical protein